MSAASERPKKEVRFIHCLIPVLTLIVFMVYGLGIRPFLLGQEGFSIEMILIGIITVTCFLLWHLGYGWKDMLDAVIRKFSQGMGSYLIMLCIGILIAAWIVSGTVPMLIYYGIKIINAQYLYVVGFVIACVFSMVTGTSWGSAGTVGIVIMGVAHAVDADLAIVAGAVVSGALFGDKMSPLSDTTNLASMAAQVDVYEHIGSMAYSTVPAAVLAGIAFYLLGFAYPPASSAFDNSVLQANLAAIREVYNFNILLLLPPVLVVVGSVKKWPTVPILIIASLLAVVLAAIFQRFTTGVIVAALTNGFRLDMITWADHLKDASIIKIFQRGGMYSMSSTIFIGWLIFSFMGLCEIINAMPVVVNRVFSFASSRTSIVLSTLVAGVTTLAVTGNGYAGCIIGADVFKSKYDENGIPRRILSRSLEDSTTMFDACFPWAPTGIFMATTLGVATTSYLPFLLLTLFNTIFAVIFAVTGVGGYKVKEAHQPASS